MPSVTSTNQSSTQLATPDIHLSLVSGGLMLSVGPGPTRKPTAERVLVVGGGVTGLTVSLTLLSLLPQLTLRAFGR